MKFRTGLIIGGAVGYYFGAKAGRRRYEQLNQMLHRVTDSAPVRSAATRARTAVGRDGDKGHPTADNTIELIQPEWTA